MIDFKNSYKTEKNIIFDLLNRKIILESDIERISNMNLDEITLLNESKRFKDKILITIYFNPYLLCNDKLISNSNININIDTLAKLLIKRFNEEINEYRLRLSDGEISEQEFNNNQLYLNYLYFSSSMIGEKISRYYYNNILYTDNKYCKKLLK